jgi:hypothetical protein
VSLKAAAHCGNTSRLWKNRRRSFKLDPQRIFYFRRDISITGLLTTSMSCCWANPSIASPGIAELLLAELDRLDPHLLDKLRVGSSTLAGAKKKAICSFDS